MVFSFLLFRTIKTLKQEVRSLSKFYLFFLFWFCDICFPFPRNCFMTKHNVLWLNRKQNKSKEKMKILKSLKCCFTSYISKFWDEKLKRPAAEYFFYKRVDPRKFDETPSWVIVFNFQLQQKSKILKVHTYFDAILKQWSW